MRKGIVGFVMAATLAIAGSAPAQVEPVVEEVCAVLGCEALLCGSCEGDLTQCQSDLGDCNTGYASCQSDLNDCDAERAGLESDLQVCNDDLGACNEDLAACGAKGFPASGQTTAYTADKNDGIPGAVAVADDGTAQAGAALAYQDNGDGTVTDLNTGLIWEKKGDNGGLHDKDNSYLWSGNGSQETIWDWLDDVNAEGGTGFAGHNDWRIPNVKELQSIVNYQAVAPSVSTAFNTGCVAGCSVTACSCTQSSAYWSSSTLAASPYRAWYVSFSYGGGAVNSDYKSDYDYSYGNVRAVRGGS